MRMYFLSCLLTNVLLTASENKTTNQLWTSAESSNVSTTKSTKGVISLPSSRGDHRRDVLVVLPVMQGNSDLTNSNLQMLYTKIPITTIINEQPINQTTNNSKRAPTDTITSVTNPVTHITVSATTTPNVTERYLQQSTTSITPLIKGDDYHHPYTDFLFTEIAPKTQKSPLDYGYPESFKFAEEFNDVPKNDKQVWAQSKLSETESKKSMTTEDFIERNPFQMFESIKPLEINKMMSKPVIPVTDSIIKQMAVKMKQESTETPYRVTKQPSSKRPTKKPQKVKLNPQKLNDVIFSPFVPFLMTSTDKITTEFSVPSTTKDTQLEASSFPATAVVNPSFTYKPILQPSTMKLDGESQDIPRNLTFLAVSTDVFLSTPYSSSSDRMISPIQSETTFAKPLSLVRPLITTAKTSDIEMITNSATTTSFSPNPTWVNEQPATPIMETNTSLKAAHEVKPSDSFHSFDSPANSISQFTTAKPNFPADMLTNDMKNLLITLGLLKPEQDSSPLPLVSSTAAHNNTESPYIDNLLVKQEPVAPTVDPNSYVSFKKLPVNYDKPQMSNDMRDLLSSFGLLPTTMSTHLEVDSILTRISRQQKLENANTSTSILDEKMRQTLENLGLMKPTSSQMNRKGHVFQPSVYLEKLGDLQQAEKINNALEMIRMLSMSKDVENLPIEELEQKLRNVTALLREENFLDSNATDTPELTTESLSTTKNLIFHNNSTTVVKEASGKAFTTTVKQTQTTANPITSTANSGSTISSSKKNASVSTLRYSRQRDNNQITTTPSVSAVPSTTSSTTAPTLPIKSASSTVATATSAKTFATTFAPTTKVNLAFTSTSRKPTTASAKIKLGIESSTSSGSAIIVTPASVNITEEEHNQVNYTPDASSVSLVKLSHNKNNINVVMSPPPNSLSVQELQNLLKSNGNGINRQQALSSATTSSTTPGMVSEVAINNINSIEDISSVSNTTESSSNVNNSNSFNDSTMSIESSNAISSTTSSSNSNSMDINGITEETVIKADESSDDNPPLEALADSFGGENEQQQQGDTWQANAKPNGLYFLLDWNTFLLVGEEDKRSIRIRFSPRAGNPRNFIPVKVP